MHSMNNTNHTAHNDHPQHQPHHPTPASPPKGRSATSYDQARRSTGGATSASETAPVERQAHTPQPTQPTTQGGLALGFGGLALMELGCLGPEPLGEHGSHTCGVLPYGRCCVEVAGYLYAMSSSHSGTPKKGVASRHGGVTRARTLSSLDIEIIQFLTRFQIARGHHITGWTGGSPHTITRRLSHLAAAKLIRSYPVAITLRHPDGTLRDTQCHVWSATGKGATLAGDWLVPGTGGMRAQVPVRSFSRQQSDHILGVVDLAVWYRRTGFEVASEREILSLERATNFDPERPVQSFWSTTIPGRSAIHPPDMGAVSPDGTMWAIELERALKTVDDYRDVISAYRAAGRGQIWHVARQPTSRRLIEACKRLGVQWGPSPVAGVMVSHDGLIRFQGWLPGRSGLRGPATWKNLWPRSAPAGLPTPTEPPDLTATWRQGRIVDINDEPTNAGVFR